MIAIILVNWNGHRDTIECLESLQRLNTDQFVALIVDNASRDHSMDEIVAWSKRGDAPTPEGPPWPRLPAARQRQPVLSLVDKDGDLANVPAGGIALVQSGANLGFAGANNVGMRLARKDPRITHIWLLNNDTVIAPDCAEQLLAFSKSDNDAALIGTLLMYYHAPDLVQGVAGYFKYWLARGGHIGFGMKVEDLPPLSQIEQDMAYVMGASMFLSIATYDAIGPMSEDYFLYFEELDWAERLKRSSAGRQTVCLDAVVYHKEGGSIGTSSLNRPSDNSLFYLTRNLIRYMWRWHPGWMAAVFARVLREMYKYAKQSDWQAVRVLSRAAAKGMFG